MTLQTPSEVTGLPPIVGARPHSLILGNAPSAMSLAAQQYYANPRNVFWRIMADIAGFDPRTDYPQRTAALVTAGIAVWDVLASCRRRGSLDSSIERDSMVVNDFESFFAVRPTIGRVFFGGGAAQANYRRLAVVSRALEYRRLPSTSPANTVVFQVKLDAWREAFADLQLQRFRELSGLRWGADGI